MALLRLTFHPSPPSFNCNMRKSFSVLLIYSHYISVSNNHYKEYLILSSLMEYLASRGHLLAASQKPRQQCSLEMLLGQQHPSGYQKESVGNTPVLLLCQISFPLLSPLPLLILEISLKTGMGLSLSICAWPSHLVLSVCRNRGQIAKIAYGFPPSVVGFGFPNLF